MYFSERTHIPTITSLLVRKAFSIWKCFISIKTFDIKRERPYDRLLFISGIPMPIAIVKYPGFNRHSNSKCIRCVTCTDIFQFQSTMCFESCIMRRYFWTVQEPNIYKYIYWTCWSLWPLISYGQHLTVPHHQQAHYWLYTDIMFVVLKIRLYFHDDVIKWKHFPRHWPFVRGLHRSPVNSPQKGQWRGALMYSLICVWINDCVPNREAGDLRRFRAHYDVTLMSTK